MSEPASLPAWMADDGLLRELRDRLRLIDEADHPLRVLELGDEERLQRELKALGAGEAQFRVLPPGEAVPAADQMRSWLKANATAVAPGETLVIRAPAEFTPAHIREVMDWLNAVYDDGTPYLPFRTVMVPGVEFGVVAEAELKAALRDLVREEVASGIAAMKGARLAVTDQQAEPPYAPFMLPLPLHSCPECGSRRDYRLEPADGGDPFRPGVPLRKRWTCVAGHVQVEGER